MTALVEFRCTACGNVIETFAGAWVAHVGCPSRRAGKAAPKYEEVAK